MFPDIHVAIEYDNQAENTNDLDDPCISSNLGVWS